MTDKKTLSPAEALRALADGEELWHKGFNSRIKLKDGDIRSDNSTFCGSFHDLVIYTEPTPKVVWVEYLCICKNPATPTVGHTSWYQDGFEKLSSWDYTPTGRKIEV